MEKPRKQAHAHLFTLRVWLEDLGNGQSEWRGSVKNVASGEERAFRQWVALAAVVQGLLPVAGGAGPVNGKLPTAALAGGWMEEADEADA